MDAQVDLTERSVFDKSSSIRVQIDSEPLIGWLTTVQNGEVSLEYLRKRSKECAENDKRLIRKIGTPQKTHQYQAYTSSTFTSSTTTFTSLRWDAGSNTWTYDIRPNRTYVSSTPSITSSSNTDINVTAAGMHVVSSSGMNVTYDLSEYGNLGSYTITYQFTADTHDAEGMEEYKKRIFRQTILTELWGSSHRPFDQIPLKSESTEMFPWETKKEEVIQEDKLFPWETKHTADWLGKTWEIFMDNIYGIPWNPMEKAITDHDYVEPKDPIKNYTQWIKEILPWMFDMIRDTWRISISPELVNEYMSTHWYEVTVPEYREKWFHNENKEPKTVIQSLSDSVQNIAITNNGFNVFA